MALKKNLILILAVFIVFSGLLARYLDRVPQRHYCDFRVYYKAGQDFIKGKNIYFRESEEVTPFKYSPFFAFIVAPLSFLPIKVSASVFLAVNFILTILFFKLSFDLVQRSGVVATFSGKDSVLIYGLVLLCSIRYIFLTWDSGQVSILMCVLALASLSFLSKDKTAPAAGFLAASMLVKYMPAVFLPYLFFQRKFKAVFGTLFFIGLLLALPALAVGFQKEIFYLTSWYPSITATSFDAVSYVIPKNQSIFSMVLRLLIPATSLSFERALQYGFITALLMYAVVFIPGKSKPRDMITDSALLMICMTLFNPNAWMLNFVSLILPYMLLIQYTVAVRGKDRFVLISLITAYVLTNVTSREFFGVSFEHFGSACSLTTIGSLVLYVSLLKFKFFPLELKTAAPVIF